MSLRDALSTVKLLSVPNMGDKLIRPSHTVKIIKGLLNSFRWHRDIVHCLLELPLKTYQLEPALWHLNNAGAIKLLLKRGCDPNAQDKDGSTPLHGQISWKFDYPRDVDGCGDPTATFSEHLRQERVRVLLESGADPNIPNREGLTPLHVLCRPSCSVFDPWVVGGVKLCADFDLVVRALIKHGARTDATTKTGQRPLDMADRDNFRREMEECFKKLENRNG